MTLARRSRTSEIGLRVVADAILVNLALFAALLIRFLWTVRIEGNLEPLQTGLDKYAQLYTYSAWFLTVVSLGIFAMRGLYTRQRTYRMRHKITVIASAVTTSYLLFSFLVFLVWDFVNFPRSALVPAWLLTITFVVGARIVMNLWQQLAWREDLTPSEPTLAASGPETVLVIGGGGYVGSGLLPRLLERGYRVRLLDLLLYGNEPILGVLDHPSLEIVQADFRHIDVVVNAMRGVDMVIHLGAIVGDPACAVNEELTMEVNLTATRTIAEVAKGSNVKRFVFASTCSVYGASDEILDENSKLNPVSLYARSKIASEQVLRQMADAQFTPVILRFGTIYGLSGRTRFDLVINLLTAKALVENQITVFGGNQWRPFLHVDDAALAVFKALEAPRSTVHNQVFNVGSDEQNHTIQQIGEMIQNLVPSAELLSMGNDGDNRNYRVSFAKIQKTLDFTPQWSVHEGILQVIQAIESGMVTDYQAAEYSNLKSLNEAPLDYLRHHNSWGVDLLNELTPDYDAALVTAG